MSRGKRRGSRVLVPGEAQARGGLILPGEAIRAQPRERVGLCTTCDRRFYRGEEEEWQRHVGACARKHLPEILAARAEQKSKLAIFAGESWDPEMEKHFERVGDRMLAEGRLEMKPNERADG